MDPTQLVVKRRYFSKVREAREAFRAEAQRAMRLYFSTIRQAKANGKEDVALEGLQWYLEHVRDEDGLGAIDPGIDAAAKQSGSKTPNISIGLAIGGIGQQKALPEAAVIDIEPEEPTE